MRPRRLRELGFKSKDEFRCLTGITLNLAAVREQSCRSLDVGSLDWLIPGIIDQVVPTATHAQRWTSQIGNGLSIASHIRTWAHKEKSRHAPENRCLKKRMQIFGIRNCRNRIE